MGLNLVTSHYTHACNCLPLRQAVFPSVLRGKALSQRTAFDLASDWGRPVCLGVSKAPMTPEISSKCCLSFSFFSLFILPSHSVSGCTTFTIKNNLASLSVCLSLRLCLCLSVCLCLCLSPPPLSLFYFRDFSVKLCIPNNCESLISYFHLLPAL